MKAYNERSAAELAAEKANSQEITKSLESYISENEELKAELDKLSGASGQPTDNDRLIDAATAYINDPEDTFGVMDSLSAISEENAASTEETSASMEELSATVTTLATSANDLKTIAEQLNEDMKFFKS